MGRSHLSLRHVRLTPSNPWFTRSAKSYQAMIRTAAERRSAATRWGISMRLPLRVRHHQVFCPHSPVETLLLTSRSHRVAHPTFHNCRVLLTHLHLLGLCAAVGTRD